MEGLDSSNVARNEADIYEETEEMVGNYIGVGFYLCLYQ